MARWERWGDIQLACWERWEGSEATRWERLESIEVARFLVLFKGERCRVSQRFHLFVSDVNQWNKSNRVGSRCSCVVAGMTPLPLPPPLDLTQVVKNMVG